MRELHHQGLTQREIAEIYEVSPTHMSRIIRGLSREVMV